MRDGMLCPICGKARLVKKVKDQKFLTPKGNQTPNTPVEFIVPNYVTYECSNCKDGIVSRKSLNDITKYFKAAKRRKEKEL